jgi:pyruvate ferredoxin oxidoreductase gamma subunit
MRKMIDIPVARVLLVTAIGTCMVLAGSTVAEAKGAPQRGEPAVELISAGAGYGSPHGSTRVRTVQHLLRRAGEHPGPVDGRFGPLTEAAVERFQTSEGLTVDGIVGRVTAPALKRAAAIVMPGTGYGSPHGSTRVRTVQHLLRRAGEHPGPVDGRFGPLTEAAVERFQAREGLAVDGIVGEATRASLEPSGNQSTEPPAKRSPRPHGDQPGTGKDNPVSTPGDTGGEFPIWLAGTAGLAGLLLLAGGMGLAKRSARRPREGPPIDVPSFQVRIHSRQGRGAMRAAELLSVAALVEGRHALAFRSLRSGATGPQVVALCRIGGRSVRPHEPVRPPDGLIIEDPGFLHLNGNGLMRLRPGGYLLINSSKGIDELDLGLVAAGLRKERCLTVPASELACEELGLPRPDSALVGGFVALSGVVSLTSLVGSIRERFHGSSGDANVAAAEAGFDHVVNQLRELAFAPNEKEVPAQKRPA